jgi:hypothetical protein
MTATTPSPDPSRLPLYLLVETEISRLVMMARRAS